MFKNRATLSIRSNNTNNKRPRSPSDDGLKRSPGRVRYPGDYRGEKKRKDIGSYWSSRNHRDYREDTRSLIGEGTTNLLASLLRMQRSGTVWRLGMKTDCGRDQVNDSRSNNQTRSIAFSENQVHGIRDVTDYQRTISEVLPRRGTRETQGNGVIVVHIDETPEERMRRLKGKAPMEKTPMSAEKRLPSGLLTRDRGIISIRDGEIPVQTEETNDMVMTKEDEAEVDKLVEDFGDVVMDDDMMQNDDLLVDEPGFDAEKIDVISQLSPDNVVRKDKGREESKRA
ncbi:hypothetical protein F2Q68_00027206 [Brassica cretica]|uniref:Uncharacterized protein n=1 Tax=Brassica cretica TaxID=69181 RepID=A0A8S9IA84_BRACR|nr:hypothetical protein F2Q68_00027206 [Brassica cretica]